MIAAQDNGTDIAFLTLKKVELMMRVLCKVVLTAALGFSEFLLATPPGESDNAPVNPTIAQFLPISRQQGRAWTAAQKRNLLQNFLKNEDGTYSGAILAAVSTGDNPNEPNYHYNWTRDAAIAMGAVIDLYDTPDSSPSERETYLQIMRAYANFTRKVQELNIQNEWMVTDPSENTRYVPPETPGAFPVRYGEPKYSLVEVPGPNGTRVWEPRPFNDPWGRPQNDGPALRAIAMTRISEILGTEKAKKVSNHEAVLPADQTALDHALKDLREDLGFVQYRWRDPSFDIWEEVLGDHFFTRVVQSEALQRGAAFLRTHNDPSWKALEAQHETIEQTLGEFVTPQGTVRASNHIRGGEPRYSDLDMATIMAALRRPAGTFSASDSHVLATAMKIYQAFHDDPAYDMNRVPGLPGLAVGRYPTDNWNGRERVNNPDGSHPQNPDGSYQSAGHAWPIATLAMGQVFYNAALEFRNAGKIEINPLNRPFFELLLKDRFPKEWAQVLDQGNGAKVVVRKEYQPALFQDLLSRMQENGNQFGARLILSGVHPESINAEQFSGRPGAKRQIGARDLTWNCAAYLSGFAPAYRQLEALLHPGVR